MLGFLKRLRHGWRGPDPKWSDRHVIESRRDPRSEALARRLDKAEPFASFSFESAVTDPETGRAWVVDHGGKMQGGQTALGMEPLSPEREAALREDPTLLERSRELSVSWPIDVLVCRTRTEVEKHASFARLYALEPTGRDRPLVGQKVVVDPETGRRWHVGWGGPVGHERNSLIRFAADGSGFDSTVVGEDARHPRLAAFLDRLDALAPFARTGNGRARAVIDPETGWAWSVADEPGPDGEPARRLRSVPASRVQALAADPASLARSPPP